MKTDKKLFKPTKYRIDSHPMGFLSEHCFQTLKKLGHNIYRDDENEYSRCFVETDNTDRLLLDICEHLNVYVTMEYPEEPNEFEVTQKEREMFTQGMTAIHLSEAKADYPIIIDGNFEMTITTE